MGQENKTFSETIRKALPSLAKSYHSYFSERRYLIVSSSFKKNNYYIISGSDVNFLHLTGLWTSMDAYDFYKGCRMGKIKTKDFKIEYINKDGNKVDKDTIKSKLKVFPLIFGSLSKEIYVQEEFNKGKVSCSFAISDGKYTLGFVGTNKSRPMTLLKGNKLNKDLVHKPDLIMVKSKGEKKYREIIYGDKSEAKKYLSIIGDLLSDELIKSLQE